MAQPEYTMPEEIEAMRRELAQQKQLLVDGKLKKNVLPDCNPEREH